MSDPIFRLAEREKRRQQQVVVYRPPDVIVGAKTRAIEREIQAEYAKAPIVPKYDPSLMATARTSGVSVTQEYYRQPTPAQETRIIGLAMQLPKEKREKYIVEPTPQPTWKETTATGQIMERGYVWKTGARLHMGPKIYEMTPEQQKRVLASTTSIRYAGAGFVSIAEQWGGFVGRPTPPGPISGVIGLATGRPEAWQEYIETPLEYKLGQLPAMVLESALIGVGVGKAAQLVKKIPYVAKTTARISQAYRVSRLAKVIEATKMKVKYTEPFYTVSKVPSKVGTFYAKHFTVAGKIERQLAWGGEKWLVPSGFETWATVKEAHRFVGYPVIYGKYAGYGIIEVTKLTPYQQIMLGIEKGMYPAMGGLSARQIPQFAKTGKKGWLQGTLAFPTVTETATRGATSLIAGLGVSTLFKTVTRPRRKTRPITPTLLVPRVERIPFEREKERFRGLELTAPKQKERSIVIPKLDLSQILEQPPIQITPPVTLQPPTLMPPTLISPPTTTLPPFYPRIPRGGRDVSREPLGLRGAWFKRTHQIATPEQVAAAFFGKPKRRRKKKKAKKRKRSRR